MRKQIHIPHSLSARIITGVVATVLLVGGASFWVLQASYRGQLIASLADSATVHGTLMEQTLRHAMLTRSLDQLSEMVRSLAEQKGVESVMILNKEGIVRLASSPAEQGRTLTPSDPTCRICHQGGPSMRGRTVIFTTEGGRRMFRNVTPILNGERCFGCHPSRDRINGVLIVDYSMAGIEAGLEAGTRTMWLAAGAVALAITAVIVVLMRRVVIRRLRTLVQVVDAVEAGHLDALAEVGADEIGLLGRHFNRMAQSLDQSLHDLREREEKLRETETRYRTLFEQSPDGVVIIDPETALPVVFNQAAHRQLGYSHEEFAHLRVGDYEAKEVSEETSAHIERLLREGQDEFETEHRTKAGESRNVLVAARTIQLSGRALFHCVFRDITERKRAEQALRQSEERLRTVVETATDAIITADGQGTIVAWNRAAEEMFGYSQEEAVSKDLTLVMPARFHEPHRRAMQRLLSTGVPTIVGKTIEVVGQASDGRELPVEVSLGTWKSAGMPYFTAILRDVSERERLEKLLLDAKKMETVGALAGGMAHDFNNLMQAVLSHAQLLLAHPDDAERVCARAREIQEQVARGASLTRQLLVFSRREVVKPERLDLNELVRTTADFLHHLIRENVTVQLDLASAPLRIEADRGQLEQVVVNLAANASEAMPAGGRLTFATGVAEDGGVQLVVRDTGCGIPEGIRARIFEPFFSTKHASEGAGLGLAVVHGIVSKHGGRIAVESEVGKGTTFRITLPRKVSGEFAVVPETVVAPQGPSEGHGERVLLVEDEAAARDGLTEMLIILGYEVVAVESGEEAQALPAQPAFHVLLTDLLLPGVSGAELARSLAARWAQLKVIVMSGYAEDEAVRRGVAAGAVRFLQKPFDMAALARAIRAALSRG